MKIAPSLLSADFSNLTEEIHEIEEGGADLVHLDVMDGHFVPNLTFGPPIIRSLRRRTALPFDVHLMTYHPEMYFDALEESGVQMISVQWEATSHVDRMIRDIRSRKIQAGVVLNPGTSIYVLEEILPVLNFVLIMSVNPGFGGQAFIPTSIDKIKKLKCLMEKKNHMIPIEVDGGVTKDNAPALWTAGADILVAGSSVFGQKDRKEAIKSLRSS